MSLLAIERAFILPTTDELNQAHPDNLVDAEDKILALMADARHQLQAIRTASVGQLIEDHLYPYMDNDGDSFFYRQEPAGETGTDYWFSLSVGSNKISIVLQADVKFSRFRLVSWTEQALQQLHHPFCDCVDIIIQAAALQLKLDEDILQSLFFIEMKQTKTKSF